MTERERLFKDQIRGFNSSRNGTKAHYASTIAEMIRATPELAKLVDSLTEIKLRWFNR